MGISYANVIKEFNTLANGAPKILLPSGNLLEGTGSALAEQMDDLILVLSDLPPTHLAEMEQSIAEAAQGYVMAAQSFRTLKAHGKVLRESASYEVPKVGQAIARLENTYEELGTVYKTMLGAVRLARQINPSS